MTLQERCDAFNADYPAGTKIKVQIVRGEPAFHVRTVSSTGAQVLSGHSPMIYVTDGGGCWHLDHLLGIASDEERIAYADQRYEACAHAMQSGVANDIAHETSEFHRTAPGTAGATPKHLRVGINSAMVNDLAVANLLIAKGVFSSAEYHEAIADAMLTEQRRYEAVLSKRMGTEVSLA